MYKSKSNSMSDKSISMKRCACARWPKNILLYMFRYGYRPIPSEIDTAELEMLREALVSMGNDVHLLDKWYRKDTNKVIIKIGIQ